MAPPATSPESCSSNFENNADSTANIYSKERLNSEIKAGRWLFIYDSNVYDATSWSSKHPGGPLLIKHVIGIDATDQMRVNHSDIALKKLNAFRVGKVGDDVPNINLPLSLEFRQLYADVRKKNLFETDYSFYAWEYGRCFALFGLAIALYVYARTSWIGCFTSAFFMGAFWQQIAFIGHDTGHNGISHNRYIDNIVGILVGNSLTGISIAWWKGSHNTHHLITNDPEHDPDIQHLPFLAVTTRFFDSLYSTFHERRFKFDAFSRFLVSVQHLHYFPLMMVARLNLYLNTWIYLYKHKVFFRWLELLSLTVFWVWYSLFLASIPEPSYRWLYFMVALVTPFVLHLQINLSHFAMSTTPRGDSESFLEHQLRTTLDVDCPEWFDWFHGGLQFQVAHHLFPRLPRHNLRKVRKMVVDLCNRHGLTYHEKTFTESNVFVLRHLKGVADQVTFLAKVAFDNKYD